MSKWKNGTEMIKLSTTILKMISRDQMRILYKGMSPEVDIMNGQEDK